MQSPVCGLAHYLWLIYDLKLEYIVWLVIVLCYLDGPVNLDQKKNSNIYSKLTA